MVKRIVCLLLLALLLPCVALANPMVTDDAGLFTASEIAAMEEIITRIEEEFQMDILILTTEDVPRTSGDYLIQDYADTYYEKHNYGLGDDKAGFVYMIDMVNRAPCISTAGVMIDYITDSRLEELHDIGYSYLSSGWYGRACIAVLQQLESFLEEGRLEGSFRYDAETGKRLNGLYNALTEVELGAGLIAGIAAAIILFCSVSGRYSLKGSTYWYDRNANASCRFTAYEGSFIRQSVNVVRHSTGNGGRTGGGGGHSSGRGSSVHRSSGGMSHGGSVGRRF